MPEYGRFTLKEIKQIVFQANLNVKELMPCFNDLDNVGNYQNEYGGLLDLAIYRAMLKAKIDRSIDSQRSPNSEDKQQKGKTLSGACLGSKGYEETEIPEHMVHVIYDTGIEKRGKVIKVG